MRIEPLTEEDFGRLCELPLCIPDKIPAAYAIWVDESSKVLVCERHGEGIREVMSCVALRELEIPPTKNASE
jgi:hypothetical protein